MGILSRPMRLGCAVALENLKIFDDERVLEKNTLPGPSSRVTARAFRVVRHVGNCRAWNDLGVGARA